MISADTTELEKSLAEYKAEVQRKLKHMVVGFAMDVAQAASSVTTRGDENRLHGLYMARQRARGIKPKSGFHKGAWTYSESGLVFNPIIYDESHMLERVDFTAQASYKIGDTFSIGAEGTAYDFLQRRDDIMGDAESVIRRAYLSNLKRYYDQG